MTNKACDLTNLSSADGPASGLISSRWRSCGVLSRLCGPCGSPPIGPAANAPKGPNAPNAGIGWGGAPGICCACICCYIN